jgi:DNA topoisomerase-1
MEEVLDQISNGEKDWLDFIREFYRGDGKHHGLENLVEDKGQEIGYPVIDVCTDPDTKLPIRVRIGRYGPFLQVGDAASEGPRASLPEDLAPADLTCEKALSLIKAKAEGPRSVGVDPASGQQVYVMSGRFGPYLQLGETPTDKNADKPRRASLGRNVSEDALTLNEALKLLSLPRELGTADDGEPIVANIGRFGPYVKHGAEFRSLTADDDVYSVTLERAKELLAQEKKSMRRQRAAPKELRALGPHPESGEAVRLLDGRYGPYVTDGTTNASLPKGTAADGLTMADAVALLAARAGTAKPSRKRGAKTAARRTVRKTKGRQTVEV